MLSAPSLISMLHNNNVAPCQITEDVSEVCRLLIIGNQAILTLRNICRLLQMGQLGPICTTPNSGRLPGCVIYITYPSAGISDVFSSSCIAVLYVKHGPEVT